MGHFLIEKDITLLEVQSFKHKNVSLISMNLDKIQCLFVSAFLTQKARFEESKYKKPIWLGIKRNFLEKVAFWVYEENIHSQNGALRCILEKLLCVDESIRWVIGLVIKLPSLLLKTLTLPFSLLPHILAPLFQTNTSQESINQI